MPIAFPPARRATILQDASTLFRVPGIQMAPNLARPGVTFSASLLNPGVGRPNARPNLRQLGKTYSAVTNNAIVNPVVRNMTNRRTYNRVQDYLNMYLSGVTRDAAEAPLGNCRVMIFRTEDMSFVGEVTSDGSGAWLLDMMKGGPFFRVAYLIGAPDVAGTSRNDIVPVQV
jgi:hypothetical protein